MKPVKVVCGVIQEANRLRPDSVIPGDCAGLREVTGGEPFTVSLLWSPLHANIMLCVWLCAPERHGPARAQVYVENRGSHGAVPCILAELLLV